MATTLTDCGPIHEETFAPQIELERVEKVYRMGRLDYTALRGIDLAVRAGEMVAVVGPSGSGKTALLITLLPIRRAVRYRPGDAIRYA